MVLVNSTPEQSRREDSLVKFRWPLAVVVVAFLVVGGWVVSIKSCAKVPSETIHTLGTETAKLLEKFDQQHITRTFEESLPELSSEPGGRLELASLKLTESLSESNNLTTAWGHVDLGSTVTEIASRALLPKQAISKMVLELEDFGYLARSRHDSDGRAITVRCWVP